MIDNQLNFLYMEIMAYDPLSLSLVDALSPFIILEIPGIPFPWRSPTITRFGAFSPNRAKIRKLQTYVRKLYLGRPLTGAVSCSMVFFMPMPKRFSKKKRQDALCGKIFPVTRPDRTNLGKLYEDILNGVVWIDDAQIVDGFVREVYGETPHMVFIIKELCKI